LRIEAIRELVEHFLEAGLVVVGVVPDQFDHLAVIVGSLPGVPARWPRKSAFRERIVLTMTLTN
jgi:hypothetical protein